MTTWFIADLHFDDENIRRYENRPFDSVEKMNQTLITNWNACVALEDEVYVLGDVGNEALVSQLKGRKYLIRGNHDTKPETVYLSAGFEKVYDLPVIWKEYWMLSHAPLYVNRNMPYANLYGHVHASDLYKDVSEHGMCVSVERTDYKPVAFDTIVARMKEEIQ